MAVTATLGFCLGRLCRSTFFTSFGGFSLIILKVASATLAALARDFSLLFIVH